MIDYYVIYSYSKWSKTDCFNRGDKPEESQCIMFYDYYFFSEEKKEITKKIIEKWIEKIEFESHLTDAFSVTIHSWKELEN